MEEEKRSRRRSKRFPDDVVVAVRGRQFHRDTPTQALRYIEKKAAEGEFNASDTPRLSTIKRWFKETPVFDVSPPWDFAAGDGEDARLLLPVLAALIENTEARVTLFHRAEAEKLLWLLKAAPDCPPWLAYITARYYLWQEQESKSTTGLDAFLAFAPWRSTEAQPCYMAAIAKGLPGCPGLLLYEAVGIYSEEAKARRHETPMEEVEGYYDEPYRELFVPGERKDATDD